MKKLITVLSIMYYILSIGAVIFLANGIDTAYEVCKLQQEIIEKQRQKINFLEGIDKPDSMVYNDFRWVKTTAYSVGDGYTPSNIMANGQKVYVGAVAYNDVPLGTKINIDGNIYTVCDRVATDGVVDIYMDSIEECNNYGVQYKIIKILGGCKNED